MDSWCYLRVYPWHGRSWVSNELVYMWCVLLCQLCIYGWAYGKTLVVDDHNSFNSFASWQALNGLVDIWLIVTMRCKAAVEAKTLNWKVLAQGVKLLSVLCCCYITIVSGYREWIQLLDAALPWKVQSDAWWIQPIRCWQNEIAPNSQTFWSYQNRHRLAET